MTTPDHNTCVNTHIVIKNVWEYRHPDTKESVYHRDNWRITQNGYRRVRLTPLYAVIERTENSFLAPIDKLIQVCKQRKEAEIIRRLLT